MFLWWIGNLLLIAVVAPVVVLLANRLLRPAREILAYSNDILEHGLILTSHLDALSRLDQTRQLSAAAGQGVSRYSAALQRLM